MSASPLEEAVRKYGSAKVLAAMTPEQLAGAPYLWPLWARPEQLLPSGDWRFALYLAGRGWGKTRTGTEGVKRWVKVEPRVNLIGATVDDARDIMVEGESGILAKCHADERPVYVKHERKLRWPNGAVSLIFTADEPERLRGKQHAKLWCDELAAWRYPEAWDQAVMGLRLGDSPQAVITTTPRPTPIIRSLVADPLTRVIKGKTSDNTKNLAPAFVAELLRKYQGTRLGRQELEAELLDDVAGALWQRPWIDARRRFQKPVLERVVVGLDPSVSAGDDSDEAGIVVCGVDDLGHFYVLDDFSGRHSVDAWARLAVAAYHDAKAAAIVAEVNQGGDLVSQALRQVDGSVQVKTVRAKHAKEVRAQPVAMLYEQGRVSHVGHFGPLEDQLATWQPGTGQRSPDRLDALVYALAELSGTEVQVPEQVDRPQRIEDEMEQRAIERLLAKEHEERWGWERQ